MNDYPVEKENRVRQAPLRGRYDRTFVHQVLDEGYVAHVSFIDAGQPICIPMYYVRDGERLLLHGSRKARLLRRLGERVRVSVAVTHLDALVLARSAFHHSVNYRSVIVQGETVPLEGAEKAAAMDAMIDRLEPGRSALVRPANASEDKATMVVAVPLELVSAKTRSGPPVDDEEDMALPVGAGLVPISLQRGEFEPDA